jgi:DNA-binding LytR/AlgR family response regulator
MNKLNCLVIDDEPLAGQGLEEYIGEIDSLNCLAVVNTATDAVGYLPDVDLMYLDINMPGISGLEFLQQIKNPPLTIITTAYQQYALQGYELDVVDYILKPISFSRFLRATTKAIDYLRLLQKDKPGSTAVNKEDYFFVKSNSILEKILLDEIVAVEALANYVVVHCQDRKIMTYLTLKQIKDYLPESGFIQVHKSYIVSIQKVQKIDRDIIILSNLQIPVGANFKDAVTQRVLQGKILKR